MNYKLGDLTTEKKEKNAFFRAFRRFSPLLAPEKKTFLFAIIAVLIDTTAKLLAPLLIAYTIDTYIKNKDFSGVLLFSGIITGMYLVALVANYLQSRLMGEVGQRTLYRLRNRISKKINELPIAFFNQNKAGDLISRINNDSEKLNNFFSQALTQFTGNLVTIVGTGILMLVINWKLGLSATIPALGIVIVTWVLAPWIKRKNTANMQALGALSAEVSESLSNFKVIATFNRRDYFRTHFEEQNLRNFKTAFIAGIANHTFSPLYNLFAQLGQLIVLTFGIFLIIHGEFTVGFLISYLIYVNDFYQPLRQLAGNFSTLQQALASWDRIRQILSLESNLPVLNQKDTSTIKIGGENSSILSFRDVSFHYKKGDDVLRDISFTLEHGKNYAIVGPTGGGKSTTAALMARLYDPTAGSITFQDSDIRTFSHKTRTDKIGFILQDPFLMSGSVSENIQYGNAKYKNLSEDEIADVLEERGLTELLSRFPDGLGTQITSDDSGLSLGQKQLIAFMRTVLRDPELLILDEATANVDTVTETLLSRVLEKLPRETTIVTIAHRLNTIKNADVIFFVNSGTLTCAGSYDDALSLLFSEDRES